MSGKELLILAILTLVTVIAWIGFDIYHAATTSTITPVQQDLIKPLTPTFDHDTIVKIVDDNL